MNTDLYQTITDKVIAQLEAGTVPWVRPWASTGDGGMPFNVISGKPYRGINTLMLWIEADIRGLGTSGWLTYKQAQDVGAQVRRGEKGSSIVFFKPWKITDKNAPAEEAKEKTIPILRGFTVFHTSQVDGLPEKYTPEPVPVPAGPTGAANAVADSMLAHAVIHHGGDRAFYCPSEDYIRMPQVAQFPTIEEYYATALHELTHWTGHTTRLDRNLNNRFGDSAYAREELVAEMGAAFLCGKAGIAGKLQHAEYLAAWLKVLREDKRAILTAAGAAQRAADFVSGIKFSEQAEELAA